MCYNVDNIVISQVSQLEWGGEETQAPGLIPGA